MASRPKRSTWSLQELARAREAFTCEDAERIIAEVGLPLDVTEDAFEAGLVEAWGDRRDAALLAHYLNNHSFDLRSKQRSQTLPRAAEVKAATKRIASLAARLIEELTDQDGTLRQGLGPGVLHAFAALHVRDGETHIDDGGAAAVDRAIRAVADLQLWADQSSKRTTVRLAGAPRKKGRRRDNAFHELVEQLRYTFYHFWGRRAALSRDPATNKPTGPFFKFVFAVAQHLDPGRRSAEAIAVVIARNSRPQWSKLIDPNAF